MVTTANTNPKSPRDIAYYSQRFRNRVYAKLIAFISQECEKQGLNKKDLAERLGKDPALITRWLTQPSNLTLDTISSLLLSVDAEAEPPEIVKFADRRAPNYVHPLILKALGKPPTDNIVRSSEAVTSGAAPVVIGPATAAAPGTTFTVTNQTAIIRVAAMVA